MEDEVVGFLLVMSEASDYDGDNFRWFVVRYGAVCRSDRDRQDFARRGIGSALYGDLIQFAATQAGPRCVVKSTCRHLTRCRMSFTGALGSGGGAYREAGASKVLHKWQRYSMAWRLSSGRRTTTVR